MAESVISVLLQRLESLVRNEIITFSAAPKELKKLEIELKTILPVLRDAEQKRFSSELVRLWIDKLKDAAMDAQDLIEEYAVITAIWSSLNGDRKQVHKLLYSPLKQYKYRREVMSRIKMVNENLSVISAEKDRYGLLSFEGDRFCTSVDRQTNCFMIEPEMVGREEDEERLVQKLLVGCDEKLVRSSVVCIVGMGGLGKTALAKKVYNDYRVKNHFELLMWVCVSERPSAMDLARKVLEELHGGVGYSVGLNTMHVEISKRLFDKKFLLVLDDVWDLDWWKELDAPLQSGSPGSKVLVTTRKRYVSDGMEAKYVHELKGLPHAKCLTLFLKKALRRGEKEEELEAMNLMDIGKEIVAKCAGLPLAVNAVGSLMRSKNRTRAVWKAVLDSGIWYWKSPPAEDILPALVLSYNDLPAALKQCFVFCSLFPKDYEISKVSLIRLWVAEDFIPEGGEDLEGKAEEYFEALVGRSFIQAEKIGYRDDCRISFKMHDVVHDLAIYIAGKDYLSMHNMKPGTIPLPAHHISMIGNEVLTNCLGRHSHLRTLLSRNTRIIDINVFTAIKYLRVLDLSHGSFCCIPNSIGNLKLLKYLNLSHTSILELPKSLCKLYSLQTLDLAHSKIQRLPKGILQLHRLRHLNLIGTSVLKCMPIGLGTLISLRTLNMFVVGSEGGGGDGCGIKELRNLNNLSGELSINHIERIRDREEAKQAELIKKEKLQTLMLSCNWRQADATKDDIERITEIFEELQPPKSLKILQVYNYPGVRFPNWILKHNSWRSLEEVCLYGCQNVECLPPFGQLPSLKHIRVHKADEMRNLNDRFCCNGHGGAKNAFLKLETLKFNEMKNWEEWSVSVDKGSMPHLWCLEISGCPKLNAIPILPALKELKLEGCSNLQVIPNLPLLEVLWIQGCKQLHILPCLPSLIRLRVSYSPNWKGWLGKEQDIMPCLQNLRIKNCPRMKMLPHLPILTFLVVKGCEDLKMLPGLPALRTLFIHNCQRLCEPWDGQRPPLELESLEIKDCPILKSLPGLQSLTKLQLLHLNSLPELSSFPDGLHQLAKLQHLEISGFPSISSLPDGLIYLSRLQSLKLCNFPKLKSLPEGLHRLTKLKTLTIISLLELKSLPEGLNYLTKLEISTTPVLQSLPKELPKLADLQSLTLKRCPELKILPGELRHFRELRYLQISGLPELTLLQDLDNHTKLASLIIRDCAELSSLENGLQHLDELRSLELIGLPKVTSLPQWLGKAMGLQFLTIKNCPKIGSLPEGLQLSTELRHLEIVNFCHLRLLPEMQGLLELKTLVIWDCPKLIAVPNELQHLTRLQSLEIKNLLELASLPEGLLHLTELETLRIINCPKIKSLPKGLQRLKILDYLEIGNLPQLTSMEKVHLPTNLRSLKITSCPKLSCLPSVLLQELTNLQVLEMKNLPLLESMLLGIQHLKELQTLKITECPRLGSHLEGLQELKMLRSLEIGSFGELNFFPDIGELQELKWLKIISCPKLISLPNGLHHLTKLQSLRIAGLPNLISTMPGLLNNLSGLNWLEIKDCSMLITIPEGLHCATHLRTLVLRNLPRVDSFPPIGLQNLKHLKCLVITDCPNLISLPDGLDCLKQPLSLRITGCPLLSEKCKMGTGEYWPKISHIPELTIW